MDVYGVLKGNLKPDLDSSFKRHYFFSGQLKLGFPERVIIHRKNIYVYVYIYIYICFDNIGINYNTKPKSSALAASSDNRRQF
jgi:hypothetical protein